jgi:hypothetical protein
MPYFNFQTWNDTPVVPFSVSLPEMLFWALWYDKYFLFLFTLYMESWVLRYLYFHLNIVSFAQGFQAQWQHCQMEPCKMTAWYRVWDF